MIVDELVMLGIICYTILLSIVVYICTKYYIIGKCAGDLVFTDERELYLNITYSDLEKMSDKPVVMLRMCKEKTQKKQSL